MAHFYHTGISSTLKRFAFHVHLQNVSVSMSVEALFLQGVSRDIGSKIVREH